jgi:hypothetical protein
MEVYILVCVILAAIAYRYGKNWMIVLAVSFFLTPLGGVICLLLMKPDSKKLEEIKVTKEGMKKCPYCAELVKSEAKICRHCQSNLSGSVNGGEEKIIWADPKNKYLSSVMKAQKK